MTMHVLTSEIPSPATWSSFAGRARVERAYDTLRRALASPDADPRLREAWETIDTAATGDALPSTWERLTAVDIGRWLGVTPENWRVRVATGYAPAHDGKDGADRSWWHPSTIQAYLDGAWEPTADELARRPVADRRPAHVAPPTSGYNSGADEWRAYLIGQGVPISDDCSRKNMIRIARERGLIA